MVVGVDLGLAVVGEVVDGLRRLKQDGELFGPKHLERPCLGRAVDPLPRDLKTPLWRPGLRARPPGDARA